ncbi:hypothetical protein [Streptomyces aurantiogriseus]|uniref:hypothetical protein n=1 Tax=Streptomyces aurantiogriseus TaxID=66870 RepID=UPI001672530B|nr:hypothetical protein [Streptomyces aurantiogriseus]
MRHVPGEPVPVDRTLQAAHEPRATGAEWGKPWSTSWFVIGPGFTGDAPAFQAEGLLYDGAGVPLKGVHPRTRHLTVAAPAEGGEPGHLLVEAAADPAVLHAFEPTRPRDVLTASDGPFCRCVSADPAVGGEEVWRLVPDVDGPGPVCAAEEPGVETEEIRLPGSFTAPPPSRSSRSWPESAGSAPGNPAGTSFTAAAGSGDSAGPPLSRPPWRESGGPSFPVVVRVSGAC